MVGGVSRRAGDTACVSRWYAAGSASWGTPRSRRPAGCTTAWSLSWWSSLSSWVVSDDVVGDVSVVSDGEVVVVSDGTPNSVVTGRREVVVRVVVDFVVFEVDV